MSLNGFTGRAFVFFAPGQLAASFGRPGGSATQLTDFMGCSELANMPLGRVELDACIASGAFLSNTAASSLELHACEASSLVLSNGPIATATLKTEKC